MQGSGQLSRDVGVFGAVMMGLGSIIGTGVFVSIGIAAGVAGSFVIGAIMLAAAVAMCNGLNSAQLAASHPVSGGTYEYGYRYLSPQFGFVAGWVFLLAKSASAATAALGAAGYLANAGLFSNAFRVPVALLILLVLMTITLSGIQRSSRFNIAIVSITLVSLLLFVISGLPAVEAIAFEGEAFNPDGFFQATALMFVAYTGYGRIATLGEEVREPRRTIPRAVIIALVMTMLLYVLVAIVAVGLLGAAELGATTASGAAPLETAARMIEGNFVAIAIALGAITAMISVLLNLILGLSRVLLAMGRRRDVPGFFADIDGATPRRAVMGVCTLIGLLILTGDVRTTWSFSAFTVLVYYAITNLAALRLSADIRLFPRWVAWTGLLACLFLAFWVEPTIWLTGLALIAGGLIWQQLMRKWVKQ